MVNKASNPAWSILGAGAIGSLWACYAQNNGQAVELILRDQASLAAYQAHGGISFSTEQQTELLSISACCPETLAHPIQQLLITTKAQQTIAALQSIKAHIHPKAHLVLLQNGLGITEQVQAHFPQALVLQASTTEGAYRASRFAVVHAGRGQTLIGAASIEPRTNTSLTQTTAIAESLSFAPLQVAASANMAAVLWRKLAINCAINPLTVIHRCRNGELLGNPAALSQISQIVDEILQLSKQLHIDQYVEGLHQQVLDVAHNTANNRSSMLQDIESGRETEIDAITGYLCRLAAKQGLTLATNQFLYDEIQRITALNRR